MVLDKQYYYKEIQDGKSVTYTGNGEYEIVPDTTDKIALRKVNVAVNVPQAVLHKPTLSVLNDTLTITDNANNGDFVEGWSLYANHIWVADLELTDITVDLSQYSQFASGENTVQVKAINHAMCSSESAEATYTVA